MKRTNNISNSKLMPSLWLLAAMLWCTCSFAQSKIAGYEKIYSSFNEDFAEFKSIAQTRDEGFIILSQDNSDKFRLLKTDPDGIELWTKRYGEIAQLRGKAVLEAADGGYFAIADCLNCGANTGEQSISIFRLDRYGEEIWNRTYGLSNVNLTGNEIKFTNTGNLIIAGSALTTDLSEQAYFLSISSENGDLLFEQLYGDGGREFVEDMMINSYDEIIATGSYDDNGAVKVLVLKLAANGDLIWSNTYGGADTRSRGFGIAPTFDDLDNLIGYTIAGYTTTISSSNNVYVLQTDTSGNQTAVAILPGSSFTDQASDIIATQDGGYVLTGITEPTGVQSRVLIAKIYDDLSLEWLRDYGVEGTENLATAEGYQIIQTKDNGFAICGFQSDPDNFNQTYGFILKTDSQGQIFSNYIRGKVYNSSTQLGIENWIIEAKEEGGNGHIFYATSDAEGNYEMLLTTGNYTVQVKTPNKYWEPSISFNANFTSPNMEQRMDFPIVSTITCTDLEVDISTQNLIRGRSNLYHVEYCNHGIQRAEDAYVEVHFDDKISVLGSSIPNTQVAPGIYSFDIGDLEFGDCGKFFIEVFLQSTALEEETHCVEAKIFPNENCEPIDSDWDGASISVRGECNEAEGTVEFEVRNDGTGNMSETMGIIITEDLLLRTEAEEQLYRLDAGESKFYNYDANGGTFRIVAQQSAHHPGDSRPTVAIEGCNGFSPGFVTAFPEDDYNFSNEWDCQQNVESQLVNTKRSYPTGIGAEREIAADADLIYHLSFQNIGQDTAIRVVIRDTISPYLDPTTIRPGASSHDYQYEVYAGGILKFTFEDILLPGSSTDQNGSHIFVKYRISQKPNNDNGTTLVNGTAITFEYNEPELLEDDGRIIGAEDYISLLVTDTEIFDPLVSALQVYPNPFYNSVNFEIESEKNFENLKLEIFDATGKLISSEMFDGNRIQWSNSGLAKGMYIYIITENGKRISSGKILAQ